jgi:hypothetical protein
VGWREGGRGVKFFPKTCKALNNLLIKNFYALIELKNESRRAKESFFPNFIVMNKKIDFGDYYKYFN